MKKTRRFAATAAMVMGMLSAGVVVATPARGAAALPYQRYDDSRGPHARLRELVDRTQSDLHEAASLDKPRGDSEKRYHDAQGHLSTFDRKLAKGKFDNGELKKSIDKLDEILKKNVLQGSTRDALREDLTNLKIARDRRD